MCITQQVDHGVSLQAGEEGSAYANHTLGKPHTTHTSCLGPSYYCFDVWKCPLNPNESADASLLEAFHFIATSVQVFRVSQAG